MSPPVKSQSSSDTALEGLLEDRQALPAPFNGLLTADAWKEAVESRLKRAMEKQTQMFDDVVARSRASRAEFERVLSLYSRDRMALMDAEVAETDKQLDEYEQMDEALRQSHDTRRDPPRSVSQEHTIEGDHEPVSSRCKSEGESESGQPKDE